MEEKEHSDTTGTSRDSAESEEKRRTLSQILAEAFREGIASTKPDYDKRPGVRNPPSVQKDRRQSDDAGTLERLIEEGGSAASVLYDKAADALDSTVRLAKKAPAISSRWVEAFREGFESVRPREAKAKNDRTSYSLGWQQSGDRGIMDRILRVGGSAAEGVRAAVAFVQPGEVREAEKKIRMAEKKIGELYVQLGHEAVGSWSRGGLVETEGLDGLFDELRRNEEEIQNLREYIAGAVAARKTGAVSSQQAAKEAKGTPVADEEDIRCDVGVSGAKPDEQIGNLGNWQQQPGSAESGDFAVAETSGSAAPGEESPASPPAPGKRLRKNLPTGRRKGRGRSGTARGA